MQSQVGDAIDEGPSNFLRRAIVAAATILLVAGLGACGGGGDDGPKPNPDPDPQPNPETGQTSFYSAAGQNGQQSEQNTAGDGSEEGKRGSNDAAAAAPGGESQRQIEEGDIYRVIDHSDQILNLNRYRGLQVVDFSTPSQPNVLGRARISGEPVEMYLVGDKVYALLNNWRAYYAPGQNKQQLMPDSYSGGLVAVVDISDPKNPTVTKRAQVPGHIQTSRLTRGNGKEALFVVASGSGSRANHFSGETYVRSFNVSGRGALSEESKLDLGGRVTDIQGVENHLLVARDARNRDHQHKGSRVSVIDISDPSGKMREGDQVHVQGVVQNKHNLDLRDGILRVVSGATWSGTQKNHIETFDASNIDNIESIDHQSFAEGERLEATLFQENKAFFVTFEQIDPLFAFHIGDDGKLDRRNKFEVSGWNDYFVPVSDGNRLIGIGMNNEQGFTMAVSLYDASDLDNPEPMIARREVPLDYSRSEANRDDRAFSVLENATDVKAEDGTVETGMVLLPFNGWDDDHDEYVSGVEIFTFSDSTLTRRGTMEHGTPVRRSFPAKRSEELTANLSEAELSIFDTSKPDSPSEVGRVELAPNYSGFWKFGDYGLRRDHRQAFYSWYGNRGDHQKTDTLEVVEASKHPDSAEPVAKIPIPARAQVLKSGDRLVVAEMQRTDERREDAAGRYQSIYETSLQIWSLSDPTSPKPVKSLTTKKLVPHYSYDYGYRTPYGPGVGIDASVAGRGAPYYGTPELKSHRIGESLVFVSQVREKKLRGTVRYERTYPKNYRTGMCRHDGSGRCAYYSGGITCTKLTRPDGTEEPERCRGAIRKCSYDGDGNRDCSEVSPDEIPTRTSTHTDEQYDYWNRYRFHTLDLSNPDKASLTEALTMPESERDVTHLVEGTDLYVTHRERYDMPDDSRPYYRYYFRKVDFSKPTDPKAGSSINIPGKLIEVDGDTIVTRDYLWGEEIVENSVDKLKVKDGKAYLKATHRFEDRQVQRIALDGGGHVLVSHKLAWRAGDSPYYYGSGDDDHGTYLTVLNLSKNLGELSSSRVADYASLRAAHGQRGIFTVPGGVLLVDVSSPKSPVAQSYFPVRGWPQQVKVEGDELFLAAGRYGIYRFGIERSNLLTK